MNILNNKKNENNLDLAIGADKKIIIIDKFFLKNNKYLGNALIFKRLFDINNTIETNHFGPIIQIRNDKGHLTILHDLGIKSNDWYLFINFLKNYNVPYLYNDNYNDRKKIKALEHLEKLNEITNRLGGIPSFDNFYSNFISKKNLNQSKISIPRNPNQDINEEYLWGAVPIEFSDNQLSYEKTHNAKGGWSACNVETIKRNNEDKDNIIIWYRKKKKR